MREDHINTFVLVAEEGSFSKAAARLGISAVSVMNRMNALERELGFRLFERTTKGAVPTEAGESLVRAARRIGRLLEEAVEEARRVAGAQAQLVRIATSILRPCRPLVDVWTRTGARGAAFQTKIVPFDDSSAGMAAMLRSLGQDVDCFVSPCDSSSWQASLSVIPLWHSRCLVALPRRHKLAPKKRLCLKDMEGVTLMLLRRGLSPTIDRMRDEIEREHPAIRIHDMDAVYDMDAFNACERQGWLMEVPDIWAHVHPSLTALPVDWTFEMPVGVISSRWPSKACKAFLELVRSELENARQSGPETAPAP